MAALPPAGAVYKSVLFYSQYCEFCNEVLRLITKKNLRAMFAMVCVDQNRYQIPRFIDRVPMILTPDKRLLSDGDVFAYLEAAEGPSTDPLAADRAIGMSMDFAPVDGAPPQDPQAATAAAAGGFLLLSNGGDTAFPSIYTPPDDSQSASSSKGGSMGGMGGKGGPDRAPDMDKLLSSRDSDLSTWWGAQRQQADPVSRGPGQWRA